ncbi:hypothetical protein K449DRAFT_421811 [Hypoxylon sp. EC38]|nr:hypothetical protein K449DRAFT_421811 [Hypoxylon sp. EC38]
MYLPYVTIHKYFMKAILICIYLMSENPAKNAHLESLMNGNYQMLGATLVAQRFPVVLPTMPEIRDRGSSDGRRADGGCNDGTVHCPLTRTSIAKGTFRASPRFRVVPPSHVLPYRQNGASKQIIMPSSFTNGFDQTTAAQPVSLVTIQSLSIMINGSKNSYQVFYLCAMTFLLCGIPSPDNSAPAAGSKLTAHCIEAVWSSQPHKTAQFTNHPGIQKVSSQ